MLWMAAAASRTARSVSCSSCSGAQVQFSAQEAHADRFAGNVQNLSLGSTGSIDAGKASIASAESVLDNGSG